MNQIPPISLLFLFTLSPVRALINPNFTPVQLTAQADAIWEADLRLDPEGGALRATVTDTLKGGAPAETYVLDFSDRATMARAVESVLEEGRANGLFLSGPIGEEGERVDSTWAMLKLGTRWYRIVQDDGGTLRFREDPIDLSTVWAGDVENLKQVVEYLFENPRAEVPVRSGGEWAGERKLGVIEGTVTGMEAVTLARDPLVVVYRAEGDQVYSPAEDFRDLSGYLGLESASLFAAWGRFDGGDIPSMMSLREDGTLELWARNGEMFERRPTGVVPGKVTGLAAVAEEKHAALAVAIPEGVLLLRSEGPGWKVNELVSPEGAGEGGPVTAFDIDGDGAADLLRLHANGLAVYRADGEGVFRTSFHPHAEIGDPTVLKPADLNGDGHLDLLAGGERGAVMLLNDGKGGFRERLASTGELAYNIRPGVNAVGVGDHNRDGRVDLVLFNKRMPPQIYFNRGFAVFGYDMELDPAEGAPDAHYAAGQGQQAGLLADLDGDGYQELLMVTREGGEFWLLKRQAEDTTALTVRVAPPAGATGPVPLVFKREDRIVGAGLAAPHSPAEIGVPEPGPVQVEWTPSGASEVESTELILLENGFHRLESAP